MLGDVDVGFFPRVLCVCSFLFIYVESNVFCLIDLELILSLVKFMCTCLK